MGNTVPALSDTMLCALEAAGSDAGLWRHRDQPGYYVPGRGSVPFNRRTVRALESRGLVEVAVATTDHEVVYAGAVLLVGSITQRVRVTPAGRALLRSRREAQAS